MLASTIPALGCLILITFKNMQQKAQLRGPLGLSNSMTIRDSSPVVGFIVHLCACGIHCGRQTDQLNHQLYHLDRTSTENNYECCSTTASSSVYLFLSV